MIVGITFSCFDVLHAGHLKMLEEAKSQCDYLIVGLQIDPTIDRPQKNKPVQSIIERYIQLKSCRFVDEIVPYSTEADLMEILQSFKIDTRIIGEDYMDKGFTGKQYCEEHNIRIYYNSRKHPYSSTYLKKRIKERV
jgi:glycerol-3-phosphate cytidylyltransferase